MPTYLLSEEQIHMLEADPENEREKEIRLKKWGKNVKHDPALLKFSQTGNAKIQHPSFSLPAGHTCPYAKDCRSCADPSTGKLSDDPDIRFRCFAASQESVMGSLRQMRWHNYNLINSLLKGGDKNVDAVADLIIRSFNHYFEGHEIPTLRLHVGGDFFHQAYFAAWVEVAKELSGTRIYAYTKSLPFWIKYKDKLPPNFVLKASKGGTHDHLIDMENLPSAEVFFSQADADAAGVPVDHDDSYASSPDTKALGLLIHGTQPPKSGASKAKSDLRKTGFKGYGRKDAMREGVVRRVILTEEQLGKFFNVVGESVDELKPREREQLIAQGYDANLTVGGDGYEFRMELFTPKAKQLFQGVGGAGGFITNQQTTNDYVWEKLQHSDLKVNKVRKAAPVKIQGSFGDKHRAVAIDTHNEDNLMASIKNAKRLNRQDRWDRINADVQIDTKMYGDNTATYIIRPLSPKWKKLLGYKEFGVNQEKIGTFLKVFNREGATILTEHKL